MKKPVPVYGPDLRIVRFEEGGAGMHAPMRKRKRPLKRRNEIAKDLRSNPLYRPKVIPDKRHDPEVDAQLREYFICFPSSSAHDR